MINDSPTCHAQGAVTPSDTTRLIVQPFTVPAGSVAVHLRLSFSPERIGKLRNLITLAVFDPHGFRGEGHRGGATQEVILTAQAATRGFIPGPLPPGRWEAHLAVHSVLPECSRCEYELDIDVLDKLDGLKPPVMSRSIAAGSNAVGGVWRPPAPRTIATQAGWYRGEIHSHTHHSDGAFSPAGLLALSRKRGLDFIAISDHNTVSPWGELEAAGDMRPLVIPAMEITTFHGHAVALNVDRWINWHVGQNGWTMNDAARATHDAGGIFIMAHPSSLGYPYCTGCRWEYDDIDMSLVDGMEAWSQRWVKPTTGNPRNLRLWREQVDAQRAITAVAAADFHSEAEWGDDVPSTYVYAEELSSRAIVEGIRRGRVVLSTGPWLELKETDRRWVLMEDVLTAGPTQTNLAASWHDAPPGARLRWLRGSAVVGEMAVGSRGAANLDAPAGQVHLELWCGDVLHAMTNPVTAE